MNLTTPDIGEGPSLTWYTLYIHAYLMILYAVLSGRVYLEKKHIFQSRRGGVIMVYWYIPAVIILRSQPCGFVICMMQFTCAVVSRRFGD